jgi:hypothetical protein
VNRLAWLVAWVTFSAASALAAPLEQAELARADIVAAELRAGVSEADRRIAEASYRLAVTLRARNAGRNWGPSAKAFGESAVHRPAPSALIGYAEARLKSWPEWSNPQPDLPSAKRATLREAQGVYAAALAADDITRELPTAMRANVVAWRDCIGAYLEAGRRTPDCPPLVWIAAP